MPTPTKWFNFHLPEYFYTVYDFTLAQHAKSINQSLFQARGLQASREDRKKIFTTGCNMQDLRQMKTQ